MDKFFYIPGESPYEDVRIISSDNKSIQYKDFKQKLGNSFKFLNFNYPIELQEKNLYSAAILSFYRNKSNIYIAQTMMRAGKNANRKIPITKILVAPNETTKSVLIKELKTGDKLVNYPNYDFNLFAINTSIKKNKHIGRIKSWEVEQKNAFAFLLNNIFKKKTARGKSMVFNETEKDLYDTFTFYSKKKYPNQLIIITLLVLALLVILAYIVFNT